MAFEEAVSFNRRTGIANTTLATSQYYAVTIGSSGMVVATAGKACDGILQDNPAAGKAGSFVTAGVTKAAIVASSAAIAVGDLLEVGSGGLLQKKSAGTVVAKALEAITPDTTVGLIAVELLPSNAVFA